MESDMRVQREKHRKGLVKNFPLRDKGFNMDYRVGFIIDRIKKKHLEVFYDHKTAKFSPNSVKSMPTLLLTKG
jgi:hypothetical protein